MDKVSGDEGGEDEDAEAEAGKKRKASSPPVYVVEPPDRCRTEARGIQS